MNMNDRRKKYQYLAAAVLLAIAIVFTLIFLATTKQDNQITGQAIIDLNQSQSVQSNTTQIDQNNQTDPNQNSGQEVAESKPPSQEEQAPQRQQALGGGGGGGNANTPQPEGDEEREPSIPSPIFEIVRPGQEFEFYDDTGMSIPHSRRFEPGKKERVGIYNNGHLLSDFELSFESDINLSDIRGTVNVSQGKSFIHSSRSFMKNRTLYVPRLAGQTNVRVCENAQSLDEVFEGCSQLAHISKEYVLALGDTRLRTTQDGLFFIVLGINGTGAQSENNTRLRIFDDSDFEQKFPNEVVRFYANYSNRSNDNPISGPDAICNISFSDTGKFNMTFSIDSGLYVYNRSFTNAGVHFYNVSCNATAMGFLGLNAQDYASIQPSSNFISGPDNITRGQSQRAPESLAVAQQAQGSNITPISIEGIFQTKSWQGYFGNISSTLVLSDGNNNSLYSWMHVQPSGEVFASRAFDVNFADIDCTTQEQIYREEQALGQTNFSSDRVNVTFNRTSHPSFSVSTTPFIADQCRSTNINVNDAYQQQRFYEVLLSDGAQNVIYTALIDANQIGFEGVAYDFQLIVAENEHNESGPTPYYFFVELT